MSEPEFLGPSTEMIYDQREEDFFQSFYFSCNIGYNVSSNTDDGARFEVALTFDGVESKVTLANMTHLSTNFTPNDFKYNYGKRVRCSLGYHVADNEEVVSLRIY